TDQSSALVRQVDLSRIGARESQVHQIQKAVSRALSAGYSTDQVQAYLQDRARQARTVKFVLGAFEPARLRDIATCAPSSHSALPPVCGQCEATEKDAVSARMTE